MGLQMDEFSEWLRQNVAAMVAVQSAVVGALMVILSGAAAEPPHSWREWVKVISVGVLVSVLIGWVVHENISNEMIRSAIIGACAVVSRDILAAAQSVGRKLAADPVGTLREWAGFLKGEK